MGRRGFISLEVMLLVVLVTVGAFAATKFVGALVLDLSAQVGEAIHEVR